jgi:hypothetical protein
VRYVESQFKRKTVDKNTVLNAETYLTERKQNKDIKKKRDRISLISFSYLFNKPLYIWLRFKA